MLKCSEYTEYNSVCNGFNEIQPGYTALGTQVTQGLYGSRWNTANAQPGHNALNTQIPQSVRISMKYSHVRLL